MPGKKCVTNDQKGKKLSVPSLGRNRWEPEDKTSERKANLPRPQGGG